jgi:hypothetical protein
MFSYNILVYSFFEKVVTYSLFFIIKKGIVNIIITTLIITITFITLIILTKS